MLPRRTSRLVLALVATLLLVGCGEARQVTYVDPNGPDGTVQGGGQASEPIRRHGAAVAERAKAVIRIRAALAAARTLADTDRDEAGATIGQALEADVPVIEPRVVAADARLGRALRLRLERLRDTPPPNAVAYTREVRVIADELLAPAGDLILPIAARQDVDFRAAMLMEALLEAGYGYEASFEGGTDEISSPVSYRTAYGLLIDVTTRQLEAVPEQVRPRLRAKVEQLARRSFPGPTPPARPRDPETVLSELASLADEVAIAARVDPTYPEPDPTTPDQLRSLKRAVAAAVESWERGEQDRASQQLARADRDLLASAAAGIAVVSPELLAQLERGIVMELPDAMATGADVASAGVSVDSNVDEAIQLVEEELELLRDAG